MLGISIGSRHDDRPTARQARWGLRNAEVAGGPNWSASRGTMPGASWKVTSGRGADGVVIATMRMRVRERDCPAAAGRRDHIVEATLIGTAVARFSRAGQRRDGPALPIMPLGPQRSQAARIRI